MTIRQLIQIDTIDVIPAKPVPAAAGSGYPVFKTTFYDLIINEQTTFS